MIDIKYKNEIDSSSKSSRIIGSLSVVGAEPGQGTEESVVRSGGDRSLSLSNSPHTAAGQASPACLNFTQG